MKRIFNLTFIILVALMGSLSLTTKASESPTHTVPLQDMLTQNLNHT